MLFGSKEAKIRARTIGRVFAAKNSGKKPEELVPLPPSGETPIESLNGIPKSARNILKRNSFDSEADLLELADKETLEQLLPKPTAQRVLKYIQERKGG